MERGIGPSQFPRPPKRCSSLCLPADAQLGTGLENLHNSSAFSSPWREKILCFLPIDFYCSYKHSAGNARETLPHPEPGASVWAPQKGAGSQKGIFFTRFAPSCSRGAGSRLGKQQSYPGHCTSFFSQGSSPLSTGANLSFDTAPAAAMSVLPRRRQRLLISRAPGAERRGSGDSATSPGTSVHATLIPLGHQCALGTRWHAPTAFVLGSEPPWSPAGKGRWGWHSCSRRRSRRGDSHGSCSGGKQHGFIPAVTKGTLENRQGKADCGAATRVAGDAT